MDKEPLITNIIQHLQHELEQAITAAEKARLAATDDQSKAETQYDTLAIEAAYLAEGQSRRIMEFQSALSAYHKLDRLPYNENKGIGLGNLIQLEQDSDKDHWFFLGPAAAGYRTSINKQTFTVITPQSPMGKALLGKYLQDEISITLGNRVLDDFIVRVY